MGLVRLFDEALYRLLGDWWIKLAAELFAVHEYRMILRTTAYQDAKQVPHVLRLGQVEFGGGFGHECGPTTLAVHR